MTLYRGKPLDKGAQVIDVFERVLDRGVHVSRRGDAAESREPLEFHRPARASAHERTRSTPKRAKQSH